MPINFGDPQLPKKIAALATGITANKMVITPTMNMVTDDRFYGRDGDSVTVRVAKPLPVRRYQLNNDRNEPMKMDRLEYATQTLSVSADRIYSAVGITDEDFDFSAIDSWAPIVAHQADAMAGAFENEARALLNGAKFEYVKHIDASDTKIKAAIALNQDLVFNALVDARAALAKFGSPVLGSSVTALAGSDWAALLRKNQRLLPVMGTDRFPTAFADATIGTYAGITVVEDPFLDPKELVLYTKDAFNVWSHAPSIPHGQSGAQTTEGNLAMRWLTDYSTDYAVNRSVLSAYTGFGVSEDHVEVLDAANNVILSQERYFVRGAKLILGTGTDILPGNGNGEGPGAKANSALAKRFKGERLDGPADKGIFMDLTYQNVMEGHVAKGKPEEVTVDPGYTDDAGDVNEVLNGADD